METARTAHTEQRISKLALTSFIASIGALVIAVGFLVIDSDLLICFSFLLISLAFVAVYLGLLALLNIRLHNQSLTGKRYAWLGIILGILGILVILVSMDWARAILSS